MSVKSTIWAGLIILVIFLALSYFYGENKYKQGYDDAVATLTQDSTSVDTITVVKYDTVYINIHHYSKAKIDTVDDAIFYSTRIDTSVVIDKDTVATLKQDISLSVGTETLEYPKGNFDIYTDLLIRPVEKTVDIVKTIYRTVVKEVPASPPFYNTWLTGFITGVITFLILVIFI